MAWAPDTAQLRFIRDFGARIISEEAAFFIGAGVSREAGFVDWPSLLEGIANDLDLDVRLEHDLPALAQFHHNENESREKINRAIIDAMNKEAKPTEVHRILARLPIDTIWTTNYECLIEESCTAAGRVVEVKRSMDNLAQARKGWDLVLYKMHGCVTNADQAVLTKDDYDLYDLTRSLFTDSLKGDFVEKTFLFLGFSFTDPNIDRVLTRLRSQLPGNQRTHFWITRKPTVDSGADASKQEAQRLKLRRAELKSADLKKRNGIHTVWVEEFDDIPKLLGALEAYVTRRGVFVAGAAHDAAPLGAAKLDALCSAVGKAVIARGGKLISGFGCGIAEQVVLGALRAFYELPKGRHEERIVVRPFPGNTPEHEKPAVFRRHRVDLIARAGAVVVIAGNRQADGGSEPSSGVEEEIAIAKELGKVVIPIGISGHVAAVHWQRAMDNPKEYLRGLNDDGALAVLGKTDATLDELTQALSKLLWQVDHQAAASY